VIFVGEEFGKAISSMQDDVKRAHYATCEELYQTLQEQCLTDSLILIKASRGIGLERIIELL
jgi:UDP-N-acetylmuramyl pentapeptide synthase